MPTTSRLPHRQNPQIKALDDRYKAATIGDDGISLDQFHKLPGTDLWWWRRHLRIFIGDLKPFASLGGRHRHRPGRGLTLRANS